MSVGTIVVTMCSRFQLVKTSLEVRNAPKESTAQITKNLVLYVMKPTIHNCPVSLYSHYSYVLPATYCLIINFMLLIIQYPPPPQTLSPVS